MKPFCGLCVKRECDSCTVPMVHSTSLYSHTYAARYTLTECRCRFLSRVLFISVSMAICTGHHYSWSLCIWDARYRGAGWGDVARQWTRETALSRCCWLSQAASSPTRRNTTLSFLKCVTASGVLKTAGNTHTHTHTHTYASA